VSHGSRNSVGGGTRDGGEGRVKSIAQGNPRGGGRVRSFQRLSRLSPGPSISAILPNLIVVFRILEME
jgi:hypothetical protein